MQRFPMVGILHKYIQLMVHTQGVLAKPFVIRGHTVNFFQYIAVDYQCDLQLNTSPEKDFCLIYLTDNPQKEANPSNKRRKIMLFMQRSVYKCPQN